MRSRLHCAPGGSSKAVQSWANQENVLWLCGGKGRVSKNSDKAIEYWETTFSIIKRLGGFLARILWLEDDADENGSMAVSITQLSETQLAMQTKAGNCASGNRFFDPVHGIDRSFTIGVASFSEAKCVSDWVSHQDGGVLVQTQTNTSHVSHPIIALLEVIGGDKAHARGERKWGRRPKGRNWFNESQTIPHADDICSHSDVRVRMRTDYVSIEENMSYH
jgi:hypothetical protein